MKKALSVVVAVLLIALSVMPAFAESVTSPKATTANYIITIDDAEGGTVVYSYKTEVDENGRQTVEISAVPAEGYEFSKWIIDGVYLSSDELTKADLELIISTDVKLHPVFQKTGQSATGVPGEKKQDDSSKSPKTGEAGTAVPYVVLSLAVIALGAVIVTAKRRSAK